MTEFALTFGFIFPMFLGVVEVGSALGNSVNLSQVTRDLGHMYARGVDFSGDQHKDLAVRLAGNAGLTRNGGDGVLILSKIITPTAEDCAAANLDRNCPNRGVPVVIHRIVIGNASLRASNYASPLATLMSAHGNIAAEHYLTHPSVVATGFDHELTAATMNQERGEIAYVAEGYFNTALFSQGVYSRYVF